MQQPQYWFGEHPNIYFHEKFSILSTQLYNLLYRVILYHLLQIVRAFIDETDQIFRMPDVEKGNFQGD